MPGCGDEREFAQGRFTAPTAAVAFRAKTPTAIHSDRTWAQSQLAPGYP